MTARAPLSASTIASWQATEPGESPHATDAASGSLMFAAGVGTCARATPENDPNTHNSTPKRATL